MKAVKFKHTTDVPPEKSAMEITTLLGHIGASKIQMEYDGGRNLVGMKFTVVLGSDEITYKLPVRWEPIFEHMKKEKLGKGDGKRFAPDWEEKIEQQARRSAWRIALDWLKAQTAFIEFGVRQAEEVFLPDMILGTGLTVSESLANGSLPKLLAGGK